METSTHAVTLISVAKQAAYCVGYNMGAGRFDWPVQPANP